MQFTTAGALLDLLKPGAIGSSDPEAMAGELKQAAPTKPTAAPNSKRPAYDIKVTSSTTPEDISRSTGMTLDQARQFKEKNAPTEPAGYKGLGQDMYDRIRAAERDKATPEQILEAIEAKDKWKAFHGRIASAREAGASDAQIIEAMKTKFRPTILDRAKKFIPNKEDMKREAIAAVVAPFELVHSLTAPMIDFAQSTRRGWAGLAELALTGDMEEAAKVISTMSKRDAHLLGLDREYASSPAKTVAKVMEVVFGEVPQYISDKTYEATDSASIAAGVNTIATLAPALIFKAKKEGRTPLATEKVRADVAKLTQEEAVMAAVEETLKRKGEEAMRRMNEGRGERNVPPGYPGGEASPGPGRTGEAAVLKGAMEEAANTQRVQAANRERGMPPPRERNVPPEPEQSARAGEAEALTAAAEEATSTAEVLRKNKERGMPPPVQRNVPKGHPGSTLGMGFGEYGDRFFSNLANHVSKQVEKVMPAGEWRKRIPAWAAKDSGIREEGKWIGRAVDAYLESKGTEKVGREELAEFINATSGDTALVRVEGLEDRWTSYNLPGGIPGTEKIFILQKSLPENVRRQRDIRDRVAGLEEQMDTLFTEGGIDPSAPPSKLSPDQQVVWEKMADERSQLLEDLQGTPHSPQDAFYSQHFGLTPNVVLHVRTHEMLDRSGRKGLVAETVQSDWHQAGRKEGYTNTARLDELDSKLKSEGKLSPEEAKEYNTLTDREAFPKTMGGVPQAPFADTWHEAALKHVIDMAVKDPTVEWIAWPGGATQMERWPSAAGHTTKHVIQEGRGRFRIENLETGDILPDVFASQAEAMAVLDREQTPFLKTLYDKKLPRFAQKYVAKLGGRYEGVQTLQPAHSVHAIRITPEMRAKVQKSGQPFYSGVDITQLPEVLRDLYGKVARMSYKEAPPAEAFRHIKTLPTDQALEFVAGLTHNLRDTGFVTSDGRMIDMSHEGLNMAHARVASLVRPDVGSSLVTHVVMNDGNVRVQRYQGNILLETSSPLTPAQMSAIESSFRESGYKGLIIDYTRPSLGTQDPLKLGSWNTDTVVESEVGRGGVRKLLQEANRAIEDIDLWKAQKKQARKFDDTSFRMGVDIFRPAKEDARKFVKYLENTKKYVPYYTSGTDIPVRQVADVPKGKPKMPARDMPGISRYQSPSQVLGRMFDMQDNPVIDVFQSVMAASKNILNMRRWASHTLEGIPDASRQVTEAMRPIFEKNKEAINLFNEVQDQIRSLDDLIKKSEGHPNQKMYQDQQKQLRAKAKELETKALKPLREEVTRTTRALAEDHADVRIYLHAAGELPAGIRMKSGEEAISNKLRGYMDQVAGELEKEGIPVLKGDRRYMPRIYRALFDDASTAKFWTTNNSIPSILKFVSRLPNLDVSWVPSAHAMTLGYIPMAEYKLAFQPFLNRWSDTIKTMQHPELRQYMEKWVQDNMYKKTDTLMNKGLNALVTLEYMRIIGGSLSVALKHLSKQVGTWAYYGIIPTIKGEMQMAKVPVQAALKKLGVKGEYNELKAFQTYNNMMQFIKLMDEVPGLETQARLQGWAKMITGNPTIAAEMLDNGVSVFAGIVQGARKGVPQDVVHRAIWQTIFDANFRGGWDQPLWQKTPGWRALSMFQMTPFKLLEYKTKLVEGAIKGEKDVFGTSSSTKLIRYLVTVGAMVYLARQAGVDILEWFTHIPFLTDVVKQAQESPYVQTGEVKPTSSPVVQMIAEANKKGIKGGVEEHFKDWGMVTKTIKAMRGEYNRDMYGSPGNYLWGLRQIESKWTSGAMELKEEAAGHRREQNQHVEAMVDSHLGGNPNAQQRLSEYLGKLPDLEQDRLLSHIDNYVHTQGLPNRKWWTTMLSMPPEERAQEFYRVYRGSNKTERARLLRLAENLNGFATERFMDEWEKRTNATEE